MATCFATIVSANYLAYARTLGESLARHHPEAFFRVLVVDRPAPGIVEVCASSGLEYVFAESLAIPGFETVAFKYDLVELNTALKPSFLKYLFDNAAELDQVVYLDPDIKVFSPLSVVVDALGPANMVLTPHSLAPVMDGERPSDVDFLRNGAYNLGFIGVARSAEARRFLDWWEDRCLSHGFNDLAFGTFVDQKWIDLVPSYFDGTRILRNVELNCAYWNLHERTLRTAEGRHFVNGVELAFFHFSGVKSSAPTVLSRHQTRHHLTPGTALASLVKGYCDDLIRLGHAHYSTLQYSYGYFDNGVEISTLARRLATFVEFDGNPFVSEGAVYTQSVALGLTKHRLLSVAPSTNTMNFNASSKQIRLVNTLVRLAGRWLGLQRVALLVRYFGVLGRGANLARVLLDVPLDLSHASSPSERSRK